MNKKVTKIFYASFLVQVNYLLSNDEINFKVRDVFFKFFMCEAFYKKLLSKYNDCKGINYKTEKLVINIKEVKKVLTFFEIDAMDIIESIFGSKKKNYNDCSIKILRNKFVHNMNANVINAIVTRYDAMIKLLDDFIDRIKKY